MTTEKFKPAACARPVVEALRSGVLQGCPPSATGSAEARAPAEAAADSSGRSAEAERSATWPSVLKFAELMEAKLAKNRHKGDRAGWLNADPRDLFDALEHEVSELEEAFNEGDAIAIAKEAADVANFAMMVADWFVERSGANVADAHSAA